MLTSHNKPSCPPERSQLERPCKTDITRPEPGSLYNILHNRSGQPLYVVPIRWTDRHSELLGARFKSAAVNKPVPDRDRMLHLKPSDMAKALTSDLDTLVQKNTTPVGAKNRAMKYIVSTLFPATLARPNSAALNLYFGHYVVSGVVHIPCVWSYTTLPTKSFSQVDGDMPVLAYINRSQVAANRKDVYSVPKNNEPVSRLQQLRSKMLAPSDVNHDPYIVAVFLAMAQAHFYPDSSSQSSSKSSSQSPKQIHIAPPSFRDTKIHIITHDKVNSSPNFVIYTAVVTATFLDRFMFPHKAPKSQENFRAGMDISCTRVSFWPLLGLKERLSKALGPEIAGDSIYDDPLHISLWDPLVEPESLKRRRTDKEQKPPRSSDVQALPCSEAKRTRTK